MGSGGITERGLSNNNTLLVGSQRKMIEAAAKVVIVADHSKFGRSAMVHLAPLEIADIIVSDDGLPQDYRDSVREHGVELLLA
jgi:DeoR/GlpR family transcriptional regulator of sugar metabolism